MAQSFVVSKLSDSKIHLRLKQVKNCVICGATEGVSERFGILSCDGCAAFYEKTLKKGRQYNCKYQEKCIVRSLPSHKMCRFCRFKKCKAAVITAFDYTCPSTSASPEIVELPSSTSSATPSPKQLFQPNYSPSASHGSPMQQKQAPSTSAIQSQLERSEPSLTPSRAMPPIAEIPSSSPTQVTAISEDIPSTSSSQVDHVSRILVLENCVFVSTLCPAFVMPYLREDPEAQLLNVAAANFTALIKASKHHPITERFFSLFVETSQCLVPDDQQACHQIRLILEQYVFASAEIIKTQLKTEAEFASLCQMTIIKIAGECQMTTDTELTHFVNRVSESYRNFCREYNELFTDSKFWNLITAANKIHQYRQSTRKQIYQLLKKS